MFISNHFHISSRAAAAKISYDTSMMLVALCKVNYKLMGFTFNVLFSRWDSNSTWNMRKIIDRQTQTTDDLWNIQNGYFQTETTFSTLIGKFELEFSIPQMTITVSLLSHNTLSACIPVKTVVSPIRLQPFSSCKAIKIWLKGVIPRASIYVISVAINGWAIFIIFRGSLFNEIKSTRTKIFRQIFVNKRGGRVRVVEFDVIWSQFLLPSKLWNGSHILCLDSR